MAWIYNSHTGGVNDVPSLAASAMLSSGAGWHGPFNTKEEALNFYTANKAANPGWKAPTGIVGTVENAASGATSVVTDPVGTLAKFDLGSWFVRVTEILLGMLLIGIGLAKLTGAANVATRVVKSAAKVAVL